jgi:predicted XRE-type DNA-binding protein
VWGALEDTPQTAASMRARSDFTMTLAAIIQKNGVAQTQQVSLPSIFASIATRPVRFS